MAAIIAQITRANRERKRKKTYEIQKCMYDLPPFDPHFDPLKHNKYLSRWDPDGRREKIRKYFAQIFTFQAGETEATPGGGKADRNRAHQT